MTGVTRLGDTANNIHDGGTFVNDTASENVYVNDKAVHRVGDHWVPHKLGNGSHETTSANGSSTVFINNKAVMRIDDTTECGSKVLTGSDNVEVGK